MGKQVSKKRQGNENPLFKKYSSKVWMAWNKALDSIFDVGKTLIEAKRELKKDYRKFLLNAELPFGEDTAWVLTAIASRNCFQERGVKEKLPPHWGTLKVLLKYSDAQLRRAAKEEYINPDMERVDALNLEYKLKGKPASRNGKHSSKSGGEAAPEYTPALVFEVPSELEKENPQAILDLAFLYWLGTQLFQNSNGKFKIEAKAHAPITNSQWKKELDKHLKCIKAARNVDNQRRKKSHKGNLSELDALLSLFGVQDPDESFSPQFSFLERIALEYSLRNGLSTTKRLKEHRKEIRSDLGIFTETLVKEMVENEERAIRAVKKLASSQAGKKRKAESDSEERHASH